jgi:hypothetical protein
MKTLSNSGQHDYDIFDKDIIVISRRKAACFSTFFGFKEKYTKIRVYGLDCIPTFEYRNFYLQYILDMFELEEASFNDEYFEFKSTSVLKKDLVVMNTLRLLWENIGGSDRDGEKNIKFFLNNLKNGKCRYRNKLKRFCYFYSLITKTHECYYGDNHTWFPWNTKIKSTADFKNCKRLKMINNFFYI